MRFFMLCKRHYTNKDLISDRFGRLYHLPVELGKLGHEGVVVVADYRSTQREGLTEEGIEFRTEPLSLVRMPMFLMSVLRQAREFRPDVVLASGDIHFGAIGLWVANRLGVRFIFDVYDNYEAFASARIPGFRSLFRRTLRKADLVACVGEPLQGLVQQYNRSTVVIPNGVDTNLFRPMDRTVARSRLGIGGAGPIVGYFGAIAEKRGVDILVEAVRRLRSDGTNARLLLAGVISIDFEQSDEWIDYRGAVSQALVSIMINACDVAVIPYLNDRQIDFSNASKLAEYAACGVPMVATTVSDHRRLLCDSSDSLCEPGSVSDMVRALIAQLSPVERSPCYIPPSWRSLGLELQRALATL